MKLTELRYVVAVAREGHFGRAAVSCHISQPTLSVAIRKLEDELGVTLFERGKNEVFVTPLGQQIVEQAQATLASVEQIRHIAEHGKDQLTGPLRLGVIFTIAPYLLPRLIPLLSERAPDMPLLIEENYTDVLGKRLQHGDLDALILALPFDAPSVQTEVCYQEELVVVVPAQHPWRRRASIRAEELGRENVLLLGPGHCFRDQVLRLCPDLAQTASTGTVQRILQGGSLETIRYMVATGAGVSVLPQDAIDAVPQTQELLAAIPIAGPRPYREVGLAWRKDFYRPQAATLLRKAVQDCRQAPV